jgi:polyisoprenyl-phosphate glycosyltransferase
MQKVGLSVVIPIFNEEASLPELTKRLGQVLSGVNLEAEVILVDDGSADRSPELIRDVCGRDRRFKMLRLSRNFGHQPALSAGLDNASGDAVVLMDGDLQDRPEAIPEFLKAWREGHDVVYAVRASRKENVLLRAAFRGFYRLLARASSIRLPVDAGIFSLLDRKVVAVLKSMPERNRYFPGLRAYAGFRQTGVSVERDARFSATSRVSLSGLVRLAVDGLVSFSYLPIRLCSFAGFAVSVVAFVIVLQVLYKKLVSHEAIPGWASTLTAILFLGGFQLIMLGVIGEYIGRVYEEVKKRPFYVIQERVNLS